jgi:hypothetical protein
MVLYNSVSCFLHKSLQDKNLYIINVVLDYNYLLICISTHNGMENVKKNLYTEGQISEVSVLADL